MFKAKYIVIDVYGSRAELPVVFSELQKHADIANSFDHVGKVISAGFVQISSDGYYQCYGDSYSLGIGSRDNDSKLLNKMLGGNTNGKN